MEDTLRAVLLHSQYLINLMVLILVLMEDTLREKVRCTLSLSVSVLILVLMEDTLRARN